MEGLTMVNNFGARSFRSLTVLILVMALFLSTSMIVLAAPGKALTGEIIVSGQNLDSADADVTLNGERAITGRTFSSSGIITTSATGSATVNLGKLGRVSLSPNSTLSLVLGENSISGSLSGGQIHVSSSAGVAVNLQTPDNGVTNDSSQASDFTVDLTSGSTEATASTGEVTLEKGGRAAARKMSDKEKAAWIIIPVVAAIVIIAIVVSQDDDVTSPVR